MKKRGKKSFKLPDVPLPFKDIKFNKSLVFIPLAILILLISFAVYNNYLTNKDDNQGKDCISDSDCPQSKCSKVKLHDCSFNDSSVTGCN